MVLGLVSADAHTRMIAWDDEESLSSSFLRMFLHRLTPSVSLVSGLRATRSTSSMKISEGWLMMARETISVSMWSPDPGFGAADRRALASTAS